MSDVIISNTLDKKEVTKLWNLNNVKRKVFGSSSSAHNSYNTKYLLEHEQKFYSVLKGNTLCLLYAHAVNALAVLPTCMSDARVS